MVTECIEQQLISRSTMYREVWTTVYHSNWHVEINSFSRIL